MGIGGEIWQAEGIKRAWIWEMDNIKVDLEEMGKRSLNFAQDSDRWRDLRNLLMKFRVLWNGEKYLNS
jgi:hypothetical protein